MLRDFDPEAILRVLLTAAIAYLVLIVILRTTGKRTLSKWNAFDFIVTIALGSILASVIVSRSVPVLEGILALASLIGLQFLITFVAVRWSWFDRTLKSHPVLLLHRGEMCLEAMRKERVPESELYAALRGNGITDLGQVEAVVLETDGSFSVLEYDPDRELTTLGDVRGHPEQGRQGRDYEQQADLK